MRRVASKPPAPNAGAAMRFAVFLLASTLLLAPSAFPAVAASLVIGSSATLSYDDANGQPQSVSSNTLTIEVTTIAAVMLTPTTGSAVGRPGQVLYYAVAVANRGDDTDSFNLTAESASDPAWPVAVYADDGAGGGIAADGVHQAGETTLAATTGALPVGGVYHCFVAVAVPLGASTGATDGTVFAATSQSDPTVFAHAAFTTAVDAARLAGHVTDAASGAGLVANVFVYQGSSLVASALSAAPDGAYQFGQELPAGTYMLSAAKYGYAPTTVDNVVVTEAASTQLDLALAASAVLSGRVSDAATGAPLAAASIAVYQNGTLLASATSATDGSYRIDNNLAAGAYEVIASQLGYAPELVGVNLMSGTNVTLDLLLDGSAALATHVTRGQMAVFLCRAAGKTWLDAPVARFTDVPTTDAAYGWVERLADTASWPNNTAPTAGCGGGYFCPASTITRAQLATFLCRAAGKTWLDSAVPRFRDAPTTQQFYGWIERASDSASWVPYQAPMQGFEDGTFRPAQWCTRAEMTVALLGAFGIAY